MSAAVYLTFVFSALFGVCAPAVGRRLPPALTCWLLSAGGVLVALASTGGLFLLATTLVGLNPVFAARGHWSQAALRQANPVPPSVAAAATVVLLVLTVWVAHVAGQRLRALRSAFAFAATLPTAGAELVVVDDPGRLAYAVPARPSLRRRQGRIVVSTGLLRGLDAAQRRALLAHERAHLRHSHHLHVAAAELARAANPLLRALPAAVALATERWADEEATATTSRDQVAQALISAALGRPTFAVPRGSAVLAAAQVDVAQRITALRGPAPRLQVWRVVVVAALLGATSLTAIHAAHDTDHLFDHARWVYSRAR